MFTFLSLFEPPLALYRIEITSAVVPPVAGGVPPAVQTMSVVQANGHEATTILINISAAVPLRSLGSISKKLSAAVELRLTGDDVSILRGTPSVDTMPARELLPVYAAARNSTPAVATERIFLRLDEGASIDTVRGDIEALGFRIDEVPIHAPHCAWLEPKSGRIDEALSKLDGLRALPLTANVEPQLLRPRSWKGRP